MCAEQCGTQDVTKHAGQNNMNYWTRMSCKKWNGNDIALQIVSRGLPNDVKQTHSDFPWGSVPNQTGGPSHAVPSQPATAINFNTPSLSLHFLFHPPVAQINRTVFTLGQILIRKHSQEKKAIILTSFLEN